MGTYPVIWIRSSEQTANDRQFLGGCDLRYLSPGQCFPVIAHGDCAAIVLDFPLPGWTAAELLEEAQRTCPGTPVLICDPYISVGDAVRLAHLGAWSFLTAGQDPLVVLHQIIEEHRGKDLSRLASCIDSPPRDR